eukprot:gene2114-4130_t
MLPTKKTSPRSTSLHKCLKQFLTPLEDIQRGRRIDESQLLTQSKDLFDYVSSGTAIRDTEAFTEEIRNQISNTCVQLYNKVRTVQSERLNDIKVYLKASTAWILSNLSKGKELCVKSMCKNVKLFIKSGREFLELQHGDFHSSLLCLNQAVSMWTTLNNNSLEKSLSSMDLEELRLDIFHAYIDQSKLHRKLSSPTQKAIEAIRRSIYGALETLQMLPYELSKSLKLIFIKHVMETANELSYNGGDDAVEEAIQLFKIVLETIDLTSKLQSETPLTNIFASNVITATGKGEIIGGKINSKQQQLSNQLSPFMQDLQLLSIKVNFSLCYLFMENKSPDVLQKIHLARFHVYCCSGDIGAAEQDLRQFITSSSTYDMSLKAVQRFLSVEPHKEKALEFFRLLASQHPKEPDFTVTRIRHLQYLLTHTRNYSSSNSNNRGSSGIDIHPDVTRAMAICHVIVTDHSCKERELSQENYQTVKRVLIENINWNRATANWRLVSDFAAILLQLVPAEDMECQVMVMLWRADALMRQEQLEEALTVAMTCVGLMKSPRTVSIGFRCTLSARGAIEAVNYVTKLQSDPSYCTDDKDKDKDKDISLQSRMEYLSLLILCYKIAKESNASESSVASFKLLEVWMETYEECRAWRVSSISINEELTVPLAYGAGTNNPTYIDVLCKIVQEFINTNLTVGSGNTSTNTTDNHDIVDSDGQSIKQENVDYDDNNNNNNNIIHTKETVMEYLSGSIASTSQSAVKCEDPSPPKEEDMDFASSPPASNSPPPASNSPPPPPIVQEKSIDTSVPMKEEEEEEEVSQPMDIAGLKDPTMLALPVESLDDQVMTSGVSLSQGELILNKKRKVDKTTPLVETSEAPIDKDDINNNNKNVNKDNNNGNSSHSPSKPKNDGRSSHNNNNNNHHNNISSSSSKPQSIDSVTQAHFSMSCSLDLIECQVLNKIERMVTLKRSVSEDGYADEALGVAESQEWLASMTWNIGCFLMKPELCVFTNSKEDFITLHSSSDEPCHAGTGNRQSTGAGNDSNDSDNNQDNDNDMMTLRQRYKRYSRIRLAAKFMEASDDLQATLPRADEQIKNDNRVLSLLTASALRLDAEDYFIRHQLNKKYDGEEHLDKAWDNLERADGLLRRQVGFDDEDSQRKRKLTLVLKFTVICRQGPSQHAQLEQFVEQKQSSFLAMNAEELRRCATIAELEQNGNIIVVRTMLGHAIQACTREPFQNYQLTGELYSKLIAISLSRQQAFDRVEEFEQLLTTRRNAEQNTDTDIDADPHPDNGIHILDINKVFSFCYNAGVTLVELGQPDMAEKFMGKALGLLPFVSEDLQRSWKQNVQDTYEVILKAKAKSDVLGVHNTI